MERKHNKIKYSDQDVLPGIDGRQVDGIYPIQYKKNQHGMCVRVGEDLAFYAFNGTTWKLLWKHRVFSSPKGQPVSQYPWLIMSEISPDFDVIIIRSEGAMNFFKPEPPGQRLHSLSRDGRFHDLYGFDSPSHVIKWGRFYSDPSYMGLFTCDGDGRTKFYALNQDYIIQEKAYPLWELQIQQPIFWTTRNATFYLTDLEHTKQDCFILHTDSGLEVFHFDQASYLVKLMTLPDVASVQGPDQRGQLLFADLSPNPYKDILHLNDSGLFTYRRNNIKNNYVLLHHDDRFSQAAGWKPAYTESLQLRDLDMDGFDDLILTASKGLRAMTFDAKSNSWITIINPDEMQDSTRFSTFVTSITEEKKSFIFTQDTEGTLRWGELTPHKAEELNAEAITEHTSQTQLAYMKTFFRAEPSNAVSSGPNVENIEIEKRTLHLAEELDERFIKNSVHETSGEIEFNIPLVHVPRELGVEYYFNLQYKSHSGNPNGAVGVDWRAPLTQQYIIVDYKRSMYPEDAQYYLMTEGGINKLLLLGEQGGILQFHLKDESSIKIQYLRSKERWIIKTEDIETVYGTADIQPAKDALRWSLQWPTWRGSGLKHIKPSVPVVLAWYINTRRLTNKEESLFYYYEMNKRSDQDTSTVLLSSVQNNNNFKLTFEYTLKNKEEYQISKTKDERGNYVFPINLEHKFYLRGYNVSTAAYHQKIELLYRVEGRDRLLVGMNQRLPSGTEEVMQFDYKRILGNWELTDCKLPSGLKAHIDKGSVEFDADLRKDVFSYSVTEMPQIAHGADYTVSAFRKNEKSTLVVKLLSKNMSKMIIESEINLKMSIDSFNIATYQNHLIIVLKGRQIKIYVINRGSSWKLLEKYYTFALDSTIKYEENFIAIAGLKESHVTVLEVNEDQEDLSEVKVACPNNKPLLRMLTQGRRILGYDDVALFLLHSKNQREPWKPRILKHINGLVSENKRTFRLFDVYEKMQNQYVEILNADMLQMKNNFISISWLLYDFNSKALSVMVNGYLIGANYDIAKEFSVRVDRDVITDIREKLDNGDTSYHLRYVMKNEKFKLNIEKLSGKSIDDLKNKIKNKNLRQDYIDGEVEKMNNSSDEWREFFNSRVLIDVANYRVNILPLGVQVGSNMYYFRPDGGVYPYETEPVTQLLALGDHFLLEFSKNDASTLKLYRQNQNLQKGQIVHTMTIDPADKFVNSFPEYLAYQQKDVVKVLTFKDQMTFGNVHIIEKEELMVQSTMSKLITLDKTSKQRLIVRPITVFIQQQSAVVIKMSLDDGKDKRTTAYKHQIEKDQSGSLVGKVSVIPGGDKHIAGWYEHFIELDSGNKTLKIFDSDGHPVPLPLKKKSQGPETSERQCVSCVRDRSGKRTVTDFSPYLPVHEMTAYYGFEVYEKNEIWTKGIETKTWQFKPSSVKRGGFAFTGDSYLQLSRDEVFKGTFTPRDQKLTYLASCWVRGDERPDTGEVSSTLRGSILYSGDKLLATLLATVKRRAGEWQYLELLVDLPAIRKMYWDYLMYNTTLNLANGTDVPMPSSVDFAIVLQVGGRGAIDLDHVRFSPSRHIFEATVYERLFGMSAAVIQHNGLVTRTVHDGLGRPVTKLDEEGGAEAVMSGSKRGRLMLQLSPDVGLHETFDGSAWGVRWQMDNAGAWRVQPGRLRHVSDGAHALVPREGLFDGASAAFRCDYHMSERSSMRLSWAGVTFELSRGNVAAEVQSSLFGKPFSQLPSSGELIVLVEKARLIIWSDAILLIDRQVPFDDKSEPWKFFTLKMQGGVSLSTVIIMNRPRVEVEHRNARGEKIATVGLEDEGAASVTAVLYDALGRPTVTTKPTAVSRSGDSPLSTVPEDFYRRSSEDAPGSLAGEVHRLNPRDGGYAYTGTEYDDTPLGEKRSVGLPGRDFAVGGKYAERHSRHSGVACIDVLFPERAGFRHSATQFSDGARLVLVTDPRGNAVARYVRSPGHDHLLSTNEYDDEGRLVVALPPSYHERWRTTADAKPWTAGEGALSEERKASRRALGTFFSYDDDANLIRKQTPDTGVEEYSYTAEGRVLFASGQNSSSTVYYEYDERGRMIASGLRTASAAAREYQRIFYFDDSSDPAVRGRLKVVTTQNEGSDTVVDRLVYDDRDRIIEKRTAVSGQAFFEDVRAEYNGERLLTLTYPAHLSGQPLRVEQTYDRAGRLISLRVPGIPDSLTEFDYDLNGRLISERHGNVTRRYSYNSPGYLEEISDPYLSERITYTEGGYGQGGFGDGTVMSTAFTAGWAARFDPREFTVRPGELPPVCEKALRREGYLSPAGTSRKTFIPEVDNSMPLACRGDTAVRMARLLAERQVPGRYGYRYAYGNHRELVRAKHFTADTESLTGPLTPTSFEAIPGWRTLWTLLVDNGFLITDRSRNDEDFAVAKRGDSIYDEEALGMDLRDAREDFDLLAGPVRRMVTEAVLLNRTVTPEALEQTYFWWRGIDESSSDRSRERAKISAERLKTVLFSKGYLSSSATQMLDSILSSKFKSALRQFSASFPRIVHVLSQHFSHALGADPFDEESYDIDPNGNHRRFYSGPDRYVLQYEPSSNRLQNVTAASESFLVKHDARGNVISAAHKSISSIEYNPVSRRPMRVAMADGRVLLFRYDGQGERISKVLQSAAGEVLDETQYCRDAQGRVLVERRTRGARTEDTLYLYGPRGLLAFVRNGALFRTLTDHEGSVRLVLRAGRVVAAYDYSAYGQPLRRFGAPSRDVRFRYTGQEWDEETGLYHFYARFYDPALGRFLQPDPRAQYFSPYKYAGNSPVSLSDPDGEFAFLLFLACIFFAAGGAYLGGAAANNRWNPGDWDWKDSGTYFGMVGGGIAGAFLPLGAVSMGAVASVALAVPFAYISAAGANGEWNPAEWKWSRPGTWNALFQGISQGVNVGSSIKSLHNFAATLSPLHKTIILGFSYSSAFGFAYLSISHSNDGQYAFWKWSLDKPETWKAAVDGFDSGSGAVHSSFEILKGARNLFKNSKSFSEFVKTPFKMRSLARALKNRHHPLYKVMFGTAAAYYMGSAANQDWNVAHWKNEYTTYEGVLNGIFFSSVLDITLKAVAQKLPPDALSPPSKLAYRNGEPPPSGAKRFVNSMRRITEEILVSYYIKAMKEHFGRGRKSLDAEGMTKHEMDAEVMTKLEREIKMKHGEEVKSTDGKKDGEMVVRTMRELGAVEAVLRSAEEARQAERTATVEDAPAFCHAARRRRLARGSGACGVHFSEEETVDTLLQSNTARQFANDNDLVHVPLRDPADVSPTDFADHLTSLFDRTPQMLSSNYVAFYKNLLVGSVQTISDAVSHKFNIRDVYLNIKEQTLEESKNVIVKMCFVTEEGGSTKLIFKTLVKKMTNTNAARRLFDEKMNAFNADDLREIALKVKPENVEGTNVSDSPLLVTGDFFIIDQTNQVFVKKPQAVEFSLETGSSNPPKETFHKLSVRNEDALGINMDRFRHHLSNEKAQTESITEIIQEIHNMYLATPANVKSTMEAAFHGYLYGILSSNLKKRFGLDVHIERTSGRGYADMLLLAPRDSENNRNWLATPVIIELKADNKLATDAIKQVLQMKYLYNLSLRTVATRALVVGFNSKTGDIAAQFHDIPKPVGLIHELFSSDTAGIVGELKHMYSSTSQMQKKTGYSSTDHYMSRMILGQLISRPDVESYCFVHTDGEVADVLSTFILRDNTLKKSIVLNVVEDYAMPNSDKNQIVRDMYEKKFKDIELPEGLRDDTITRINVQMNTNSKNGWDANDAVEGSLAAHRYFFNYIDTGAPAVEGTYTGAIQKVKPLQQISKYLDNPDIASFKELMSSMSTSLHPFKDMISSEANFQASLQGMYSGARDFRKDNTVVRILPELNLARGSRIDLAEFILTVDSGRVTEKSAKIIELKWNKNIASQLEIATAEKQLSKYGSNIQSITDLAKSDSVLLIFNQADASIYFKAMDTSVDHFVEFPDSRAKRPLENPALPLDDMKRRKLTDDDSRNLRRRSAEINETPCEFFFSKFINRADNHLYEKNILDLNIMATSGSSHLKFWPLRLLENMKSVLYDSPKIFLVDNLLLQAPLSNFDHTAPDIKAMNTFESKSERDDKNVAYVDNCVPWIAAGVGYEEGVTCNTENTRTIVFPKKSPDNVQPSFDYTEDTYSNCHSIEWEGRPSIACEGENSDFVHTLYPRSRLFDHVDGWLLLAQIAPAVCKEAKNFVNFIKNVFSAKEKEAFVFSEEHFLAWHLKLNEIKDEIKQLHPKLGKEAIVWAENLLEDRREDLKDFIKDNHVTMADWEVFTEKTLALEEDLQELEPCSGRSNHNIATCKSHLNWPLPEEKGLLLPSNDHFSGHLQSFPLGRHQQLGKY